MNPRLRKNRHEKHCNRCGTVIPGGAYYTEAALIIIVPICGKCAYINKAAIYALPDEISVEELRRSMTGRPFPLSLEGKTNEKY